MEKGNESVLSEVLALLEQKFGSDAAFERAAGLAPKTVSNWRRGRSASYMRILPQLAPVLGVRASDLLAGTEQGDEAEARLVRLWRETEKLPEGERAALADTVESVFRLYLSCHTAK